MPPPQSLYATLETNHGTILIRLFPQSAPTTVDNFMGLANGTKEFIDPRTGQRATRPYYDGLTFHRVIPGFMIQGGCPLGTGTGGPGYKFKDEFDPAHHFTKPGLLAMANAGPGTNGSQFFITVAPCAWLNDRHTIFGEVIQGYEIVERIAAVQRGPNDRPVTPVVMTRVRVQAG